MGATDSAEHHKGSRRRGEQKLIKLLPVPDEGNVSSPVTWGGLITAINTESLKAKDGDLHKGKGWGETSKVYKNRKIYQRNTEDIDFWQASKSMQEAACCSPKLNLVSSKIISSWLIKHSGLLDPICYHSMISAYRPLLSPPPLINHWRRFITTCEDSTRGITSSPFLWCLQMAMCSPSWSPNTSIHTFIKGGILDCNSESLVETAALSLNSAIPWFRYHLSAFRSSSGFLHRPTTLRMSKGRAAITIHNYKDKSLFEVKSQDLILPLLLILYNYIYSA